jgi:hypothetical protein
MRKAEPAPSRLFAVLNSGFVSWLLSSVALATFTTFFATRQKCVVDSETLALQDGLLDQEIRMRRGLAIEALLSSKTMNELQERISRLPGTISEFKDKTFTDMKAKRGEIFNRAREMDEDALGYLFVAEPEDVLFVLNYAPNFSNQDFEEFKSRLYESIQRSFSKSRRPAPYVIPDCSLSNLFHRCGTGTTKCSQHICPSRSSTEENSYPNFQKTRAACNRRQPAIGSLL